MDFKKPTCDGFGCIKRSQYNEGNSKFCVGCVSIDGRKHASHNRMEHQILSDITRGVKKSLPYTELSMKYDQVYHDDMRPDLQITNTINDNIVMVEVDEKQHFTLENLKKDYARFKTFYDKSEKYGKSLSVVRVVPGENTKSSMFKKSGNSLYRNNGYLEKNPEHYNKYIKESVSKIVKIISDKQSYRYKDTQVSIGPTVKKNSSSPIFSDTSSPDVSPSTARARAILKENKDNSESLATLMDALSLTKSSKITSYKKKSPDFKKSFKCKYHNKCEVSIDGFHRSKKSVSPKSPKKVNSSPTGSDLYSYSPTNPAILRYLYS